MFLKQVLCDESNNPSCPRIVGTLVCIAGVVLVFLGNTAGVQTILAGAGIVTGAQVKGAIVGAALAKTTTTTATASTTKTEVANGDV